MPNNDLGTAHGRIRIDFDDQGSTKATTSLAKVEKQFEEMQARVIELEKQLKKNGVALEKSSHSMRKVERASRGLKDSFWGTSRIVKLFDKDIVDLTQDITKLYQKYNEARTKFKPFETTFKVLDRYQNFKLHAPVDALGRSLSRLRLNKFSELEHNSRSLGRALDSVGLGWKTALLSAWRFSYGYNSAMRVLPTWTQHVHRFAIALGGLGAAGLIAGKKLDAGFINKFLNTNVFRNIVLQSNNAGRALEKLGAISNRVFGRNLFQKLEISLKGSEKTLSNWTKSTSHNLSAASRGFNTWFKPVAAAAKQIQTFTLGVGLMTAGVTDILSRFSFLGRIPKPLLVALATVISGVLPAALQVFDKALVGTSNILMGLLSGVKQLSGGLLALPGLFAAIGTVAATVKTIFFGLDEAFKDVFSTDPVEAAEAWAKLPEHLKPMAAALKETVKGFRAMQVEIQKIAFKGVETQIKSLSEKYMPLLKTGMSNVTFALRGLKDEFVRFLEQTQTQKDTNRIFAKTAEIIHNVKKAFGPVADGLRDLATVGTQFFAQWSAGLGSLAERFAEWVRLNRESGQLLKWMEDAREGTRDLVNGTKDLGKALWGVLTMFRSQTGANGLDRYANAMQRFNEIVKQSRQGGALFDISSSVRSFAQGTEKIDIFKDIFNNFMDMMRTMGPAIQNVSDAFSSLFIPNLIFAMDTLKYFSQAMTALNLDAFTGIILGVVAGIRLLPTFLKPLWDTARVIGGFILTLRSANGVTKAIGDGVGVLAKALETIPGVGGKAANSLKNFHKSMSGVIGAIAGFVGPVALAAAGLTLLWSIMRAGRQNAKDFDSQLATNAGNVKKFGAELTKAFYADKGKIGSTVMDQVSISMETMLRDLEDTAAKAPGMIDHIADYLSPTKMIGGIFAPDLGIDDGGLLGESAEINRRQKEGDAAKLAAEKYKQLTDKNVDLVMVMTGSQKAFDDRIYSLRAQGKAGNALADVLEKERDEFNDVYAAMQSIGPKGIELAKGLDEIARAGGNATSKLNGLRGVLTGLGFLKVDELEAAAQYTTTLGDLADQIAQLKADGADFSNVWKADGTLDDTNESAAKLIPLLSQVSYAYLNAASAGRDVDEINGRLNQTLEQIAPSLSTSAEKLKEFFKTSMGAAPVPVQLALQLDGVQDQLSKDITNLLLQLTANETFQTPIKINFTTEAGAQTFEQQIEGLIGDKFDIEGNGRNVILKAGVELDQESLLALQAYVANRAGIETPNAPLVDPSKITAPPFIGPKPPVTGPVPINPSAVPPWMPRAPEQPFGPTSPIAPPDTGSVPETPKPAPAPSVIPNPVLPNLQEANTQVDEITGKMQKFAANPVNIEVNTEKLKTANTEIDQLSAKFFDKKLTANIQVEGVDKLQEIPGKAQAIADQFTSVFTTFKDKINEAVEITTTKIGELSQAVIDTLTGAADNAREAGSKFVDALAQGIETNPAAVQAAERLAAEIKERFHQSPPKKGPLAEHGDAALYGGKAFVSSYASGLRTAAPTAADAAGTVAGAAVGALGTNAPGSEAGAFFGQLTELANFASSIVDIFSRISDSVFQFAKFLSDPMGKGSFFGGSLGYKKLSEAELRRRREEKEQQDVRSMMDNPTRNMENYERQLEIITNAENAVVRDSGSVKSQEAPRTVGALLKEAFPEIASIGGARPDRLPYHREGRALDIMIPDYNTEEGKALGDRINAWALANAEKIGLVDTIWQDYWQPADGSRGNFMGNTDPTQGHYDHVHLTFAPGASVDLSGIEMSPEELSNYQKTADKNKARTALERLQEQYGPPLLDGEELPVEDTMMRYNAETGNYEIYTPHGKSELPGPGVINPLTKKPYTPEETLLFEQQNPLEFTLPEGMTPDRLNEMVRDPNFVVESQQQTLERVTGANADMAAALEMAKNPENFSDDQLIQTLTALDNEIFRLNENDTPGNRQIARDLETVKSTIMDVGGFEQNANPIDTVASIAQQAAGVASDIIGTVITGIEAIGAADDIAKTLVRGVANTKDVDRVIDNVQKFIELGAKISGSVASVTGLISSIVGAGGGADPSGGASGVAAALGSISTIASLVQAGFETTNAVIDMTQEAMRIAGTYVGDFLGYLVGGMGGQLTGNVKFLLDKQTNQLLTYTAENAMDKRIHNVPFAPRDMASREQLIGNINVYGGPGSDPRDLTRQMMYQVNSAQYAGALAQ